MTRARAATAAALLCAATAGCGVKGAPLPPLVSGRPAAATAAPGAGATAGEGEGEAGAKAPATDCGPEAAKGRGDSR
jgi:hypothetical protein